MTALDITDLHYDVVVVGAGPGGLMAAVEAGRSGLRVALIERHGFVAGTINVGLCLHGFEDNNGVRVVTGRAWDLIQRSIDAGGAVPPVRLPGAHMYSTTPVDMSVLQACAFDMIDEAGVVLWLHLLAAEPEVEGERISAIRAWGPTGQFRFHARTFIDATGNADIAYRAGVPSHIGRESDSAMQPMTLGMTMAPVDIDSMMASIGGPHGKAVKPFTTEEDFVWFSLNFSEWVDEIREIGIELGHAATCWGNSIRPSIVNLNSVKVVGRNGADNRDLTLAETHSRRTAMRFATLLREKVPGFESAYPVRVSPFIGIRETRHIEGIYTVSKADAVEGRMPDDTITICGYPIDIHDPKDGIAEFIAVGGGRFGIAFGALVPKKIGNLLVSGRAISASHEGFAGLRVMGTCLALGEACGAAAVLSAKRNVDVAGIDGVAVRKALEASGALPEL
jgi:hypothetical protein